MTLARSNLTGTMMANQMQLAPLSVEPALSNLRIERVTEAHRRVLAHIVGLKLDLPANGVNRLDIRRFTDHYRSLAIDLGMMEPPLVDIDGEWLFITPAGRAALNKDGV